MSDAPPDPRSYAAALQPRAAGADPAIDPAALGTPPPPARIVEALLFAGGQPLTPDRAAAAVRGLTPDHVRDLIDELNRGYRRQNRPYTVRATDAGYVLALRPRYQTLADRL